MKKVLAREKKHEQRKPPTTNLARNNVRRSYPRKRYQLQSPNLITTQGSHGVEVAVEVEAGVVEVEARPLIKDARGLCPRRIVIGKNVLQSSLQPSKV